MVLGRDDQPQVLHARELVRLRNEAVLDRPPAAHDRPLDVRRFVCVEREVDGRITDRVGCDAPPEPVRFFHPGDEGRAIGVDAGVRAAFAPWLRVRFAHPAAFESAVDGHLDAADAQPLIALVWRKPVAVDGSAHSRHVVCRRPDQLAHPNRE